MRCAGCGAVGTGAGRCLSCGAAMALPDEELVQLRAVGDGLGFDRRSGRRDGTRPAAPPALEQPLSFERRLVPRGPSRPAAQPETPAPHEALAEKLLTPIAHRAKALEPAFVAARRAVSERIQRHRGRADLLIQEAAAREAEGDLETSFVAYGRALLAEPLDADPVRPLERIAASARLRFALAELYEATLARVNGHPSAATLQRRAAQLRELAVEAGESERRGWDALLASAAPAPHGERLHGLPAGPTAVRGGPIARAPREVADGVAEQPVAPPVTPLARLSRASAPHPSAPSPAAEASAVPNAPPAPTRPAEALRPDAVTDVRDVSEVPFALPLRKIVPAERPKAMQVTPARELDEPRFVAPAIDAPDTAVSEPPPATNPAHAAEPAFARAAELPPVAPADEPAFVAAAPTVAAPARPPPPPDDAGDDPSIGARQVALGRTEPAAAPIHARLLSWCIDLAVVAAIPVGSLVAGTAAFAPPGLSLVDHLLYAASRNGTILLAALLLGLLTAFVYLTLALAIGGRTLGDHVAGLRSVVEDGSGSPDLRTAALRSALAILGTLAFLAGPLWALVDPRGQAFHDKVVGTRTVRA